MKNLKKILSLVLALAMALSLMTVAFAKDTGDFADGDDVTYAEAVDVMATVGVFNGVGDGSNFDPKGTLTREQAAKIITYMIMGQAQADKLVATIAPFADVSADRWSAGAIAYCASEGIMNGTGNGKFNPTGELTGLQFSKMLLVALGYDAEIEEMTGAAWGLATSKLAYAVELDDGMDDINLTVPMTREQAAQMAFTTMQTPLVRYPSKGNTISVNGAVVTFGAQEAEYVTSEIAKEQTISDTTLTNSKYFTIEFAEKYCPKLVLSGDYDAFGRPSYTWTYDKVDIGTYVDFTDLYQEYTTKVTGRDLYDLLGKTIVDDYDFTVVVDGVDTYNATNGASGISDVFNETYIKRDNKATLGRTGNGVLTQVFVNGQDKTVRITIINSYLAKATSDYNDKKDTASFDVYDLDGTNVNSTNYYWKSTADKSNDASKLLTVSGEDFDVKEIKEDDIVIVTVADGAIQTFEDIDVVADAKITSFKLNDNLTVDGTKYDYATTARYDFEVLADWTGNNGANNLKEKTYNVYLDQYGYVVGVDLVEGVDNYVFITGVDSKTSNLSAKNYDANAIFLDGSMKTITFDNEKSKITVPGDASLTNTWCTYTVNNKDVYTLTQINDYTGQTSAVDTGTGINKIKVGQYHDTTHFDIDVKNVALKGALSGNYSSVYGNDNTVYLNVETKGINTGSNYRGVINKVVSTVTGIKNASMDVLTQADAENQAKDKGKVPAANVANLTGNTAWGTYVLYKNNGYVIAAVTVADDSESTKNLVYAHTGELELETYDETADEWTWTRKVIHNGEEITITEKGDGLSELKEMNRYNWYQVAYNANGEVVSVTHAADTLVDTAGSTQEYEDTLNQLPNAINNGKDTILYEESLYNGYSGATGAACPDVDGGAAKHTANPAVVASTAHPKLEGSLWYVRTTDTTGVYVDESVKVIFIQTVDNKVTTSIDSGKSALKYVVDHLNTDSSNNYKYETSMVVDKGFAKVVIVRDLIGAGSSGSNNQNAGLKWIDTDAAHNFAGPKWNGTDAPTLDDIRAMLEDEGCTNISYDASNGWSFTTKGGTRITSQAIAPAQQFKVTINGKTHYVASGSLGNDLNSATIFGAGYAKATHGTYAKATYADKSTDYVALASTPTISQDVDYEIGYYEIDVTSAVGGAGSNGGGTVTADTKPTGGYYTKKVAGDANIPVTITTTAAVTGGGLKFTADKSATVIGSVPAGAAGDTDVTLKISTAALADDVTVTLTKADQAEQIRIYVNGTAKNVEVGSKVHAAIDEIPDDAASFALVQVLGYGDTAGTVTAANATAVKAGNATFSAGDADHNFGNVEYVKVDTTANASLTGFKNPTYTYDKGTDANQALFDDTVGSSGKYAPVGATVKLTITCSATVNAAADRTGVTKQFKVSSATATDKIKYNGTSTVLTSTETAEAIESTVPDTGTAVDIIKEDDTITVTFNAKTATKAQYTPSTITVVAYVGAT